MISNVTRVYTNGVKTVITIHECPPLTNMVLPLPGGPNNRIPRVGARRPVNSSGRRLGKITDS